MASVNLINGQCYPHPAQNRDIHCKQYSSQQIMTLEDSVTQRSTSVDYDAGSDSARDMSSPSSPAESESRDPLGLSETPTKKNKRKLSEPRKRADLHSKKPQESSSKEMFDDRSQKCRESRKFANGDCKRSPLCKRAAEAHRNRDSPSSSSSVSNNESDSSKAHPLANVVTPHLLPPILTGVHSSTFGYVPGFYLSADTFSRQGIHASFSSIPLNLHSDYISGTAVASTASSSLYPLAVPGLVSSPSDTTWEVSKRHLVKSRDQVTNPPVQSPLPSTLPPSSPFSVLHIQPSPLHRPSLPRPLPCSNNEDDDDDELSSRAASPEDLSQGGKLSRKQRKNYKNMTRERRVEANARERTRVHTISAAFDALRRAVPSYSHNQKLSKLAILRIASSYILALARLNDQDYTSASDQVAKPLTFAECVDMCTNTIQTEGRVRRRH